MWISDGQDYYSGGMVMPGRSYDGENYRFSFSGQEKDDELKGLGNSLNFLFRMYDARLNRFLSTDPLEKQFAFNSPYVYAMNRVIDGIDIEGKEYLNANEAKIEITSGVVHLRVENLSAPSRSYIQNRNKFGPWNGGIGYGGELNIPLAIYAQAYTTILPSNAYINPIDEDQKPTPGYSTRDENTSWPMPPGGSRLSGGVVVAFHVLNWTLATYKNGLQSKDNSDVNDQLTNALLPALVQINKAIEIGLIDKDHQNESDIGKILNVVLTGKNSRDSEEINNIGMTIVKHMSRNLKATSYSTSSNGSDLDGIMGIKAYEPNYPDFDDKWNDDFQKKLDDEK